jgi:hypothetical protein
MPALLTVAALAATKRLPVDFLGALGVHDLEGGGVVAIPYYAEDGELMFTRTRQDTLQRFYQPRGVSLASYGLWKLDMARRAGYLTLVEGECLTEDAEVLTPDGWVSLASYEEQEVAVWHPEGHLTMEAPLRAIHRPYRGSLFTLSNEQRYFARVTPAHKMPWLDERGRLRPTTVSDLFHHGSLPRAGFLSGPGIAATDDEIRLLLAICADGSIHARIEGGPYIFFSLCKERKITRLRDILSRLNISFRDTPDPHKGGRYLKFRLPPPLDRLAVKCLPTAWLVQASLEQRELILAEMVEWDGNHVLNREQSEFSSSSLENAQWMQTMAHTTGRCSTIMTRENKLGRWHKVSILHNKRTTSCQSLKRDLQDNFDGNVHCLTVSSGFFLVRQGGCISVTGNSDCWALWLHGEPALGIPGDGAGKVILADSVEHLDRLYLHIEPGQSGEQFRSSCVKRLREIHYRGQVLEVRTPGGGKDPADLHVADPEHFSERWKEALRKAQPVPLEPANGSRSANSRNGVSGNGQHKPDSTLPPLEEWSTPIPLAVLPRVEPFPLDVLPLPLQRFVEETAWATNSPLDFTAVPLLVLAGGAIGNSRVLAITRSHWQSAALYGAVVGVPASGKSPPLIIVKEPFEAAAHRYYLNWQRQLQAWEQDCPQTRGKKPTLRRLMVDDVTAEKLVALLAENPRGLLMIRDELAALVTGFNQYKEGGKGSDRQYILKMWAHATIHIDRKSNPDAAPIKVRRPFLGIIGGIQPALIEWLKGERKGDREPPDDGFLDRFLTAYPDLPSAIGEQWRTISESTMEDWKQVVENLLALDMYQGDEEELRPRILRLTPCGCRAWERFTQRLADEINEPDFPLHLRGCWGKLRGYGGRLALVLHCLRRAGGEEGTEEVDGISVERADRLVYYFQTHAQRLYGQLGADPRTAPAEAILRHLARRPEIVFFSRSDLYVDLRRSIRSPDALDRPLQLLVQHRYLRRVDVEAASGLGRKPTPRYEVNPLWRQRIQKIQTMGHADSETVGNSDT